MDSNELAVEELVLLIICYHGTNAVNAKSILKRGFLPCTYFAAHLEDALGYGGKHVFEVAFHRVPSTWQFMCPARVKASMIVSYTVYTARVKFRNDSLRKRVFKSNIKRFKPNIGKIQNATRTARTVDARSA